MLTIFLNGTPVSVNKSFRFAQALTKKGLNFFSGNRNISFVFYFIMVLLLAEQDGVFQKSGRKQNLIWLCSASNGKIILTPLKEIITFYISFTLIDVREPRFQKLFTSAFMVRS